MKINGTIYEILDKEIMDIKDLKEDMHVYVVPTDSIAGGLYASGLYVPNNDVIEIINDITGTVKFDRDRYCMILAERLKVTINNDSIFYLKRGYLHREDGPAAIWVNGYIDNDDYYIDGVSLTIDEWKKEVTKIQLKDSLEDIGIGDLL